MSTNFVEICQIEEIKPLPDADRLEIAYIRQCPTVVLKGEYKAGDKVVYFPPDMLIPQYVAEELGVDKYLKHSTYPGDIGVSKCRVAAARLRGQPSYGFIVPVDEVFFGDEQLIAVGTDVSTVFNAVKYEPPVKVRAEDQAPEFPQFHRYTDIENINRYPDRIREGEMVRITEKIHGTNSRVGLVKVDGEFQFVAGSHKTVRKRPDDGRKSRYWAPLDDGAMLDLISFLCNEQHDVIVFGEIYGPGVQDMTYGVKQGEEGYRVFDISVDGRYLNFADLEGACQQFGVEMVPVLYIGPFSRNQVNALVDGPTTLGSHAGKFKGREGVVITPLVERRDRQSRAILKAVSVDYLDRKGALDLGEAA